MTDDEPCPNTNDVRTNGECGPPPTIGGRRRRGKKSRKSRKGRKGKKSRKNKRRTKRR